MLNNSSESEFHRIPRIRHYLVILQMSAVIFKKNRKIHQKINQKLIRLPFWAGEIEVNATLKASLRRREEAPGAAARLAVRDAAHEAVAGVPRGVVARPVLRQGR